MIKRDNFFYPLFQRNPFPLLPFLLFPLSLQAQLIDTHLSEPSTTDPHFNTEIIRLNKIKSITFSISQKPDLQVIDDKGLVQCFEFDSLGLVKRSYTTSIRSQEKVETLVKARYYRGRRISPAYTDISWKYIYDTAFTWFVYDKEKQLILKRSNYGDIFSTYYYEYDSLGRVTKEINCRETNKNLDKHHFELGVQTVLSTESFQYVRQSPSQLKKLCLNDDGKVYKQGIINRDSNTVTEDFSFIVGYVRYSNIYTYDKSGKLISKTYASNENGDTKTTVSYTYDENGNVSFEKRQKNDTLTDDLSYLYDESGKLLRSKLDRDYIHLNIEIVKVMYEYYP
jgi:hypothetical protein